MKLTAMDSIARRIDWPCLIAWMAFLAIMANTLAFALHCANPVLMSDDWYFLDVFVRKVVSGEQHFADFFVKRIGADHSEPLIKLILMWCARAYHLDIAFEAFIGVFIAAACALLFRYIVLSGVKTKSALPAHQLAWVAIAALIFSLNGAEIWAWALNSLQYSSVLLLPVFMWTVWRTCQRKKYGPLAVVTLFTAVISDDNAIIGIIATLVALLFQALLGKGVDRRVLFRILGCVLATLLVVRIGYLYAPVAGGMKEIPLTVSLQGLVGQLESWQWPKWIDVPMTWAITSHSLPSSKWSGASGLVDYSLLGVMLLLQCWFWVKAIRCEWNLQIFVAVCMMLVTYGWIAGVLLYRVPVFGPDYFRQDRYVRLFEFDPVALILMWSGSIRQDVAAASGKRNRLALVGVVACLALLVVQVPLSRAAWASVPYRQLYDQNLARQIYALAENPRDSEVLGNCDLQLPICGLSLEKRKDLLDLLRDNHLNIFSPAVLQDHPYLLGATDALDSADRLALLAAVQTRDAARKTAYEFFRTVFLGLAERVPNSEVDVNTWPARVPLMLGGCWNPDGERHHASSWCGPDVTLVLRRPSISSSLTVKGWFPSSLYERAGRSSPVTITVTAGSTQVRKIAMTTEGAFTIDIPAGDLPLSAGALSLVPIKISTDGSFNPSRFSHSSDTRNLSMKLTLVAFSGNTSSPASQTSGK